MMVRFHSAVLLCVFLFRFASGFGVKPAKSFGSAIGLQHRLGRGIALSGPASRFLQQSLQATVGGGALVGREVRSGGELQQDGHHQWILLLSCGSHDLDLGRQISTGGSKRLAKRSRHFGGRKWT